MLLEVEADLVDDWTECCILMAGVYQLEYYLHELDPAVFWIEECHDYVNSRKHCTTIVFSKRVKNTRARRLGIILLIACRL
jgi:hypothetical protein